jgi:glycosyltransferase involved in cell wall biosynthesis
MNILITPDILTWAIGNLTRSITNSKSMSRFNFTVIPVHPRDTMASFVDLDRALKGGIDLWHAMYWHSAQNIIDLHPLKDYAKIPKLLSHHNHYSLDKGDWHEFEGVAVPTNWAMDKLKTVHSNLYKIPYGIDLDRFSFVKEYPPEENTVGYIGRVVPWKNLAKICEASKELGYKVLGSGYIEDQDYWKTVDKSCLDYKGNIGRAAMSPANVKDDLYAKMKVFVAYSTGEKETGTLPLLEAMARGVPVLATSQGMARDIIEDGINGIIFTEENFKEKLKMLMEDEKLRLEIRNKAWDTIKNFSEERMAWNYGKAYYDVIWQKLPVVSVIIPTCNRDEALIDTIISVDSDYYQAKEIIVIDDGINTMTQKTVLELKKRLKTPILYLSTGKVAESEYNLARARNMGVQEAMGSVLLFLDDRLTLKQGSLEHIANIKDKEWRHGEKITKEGISTKRSFMENFSWVKKRDFVRGGMFNERMNRYGGMSEITREQFKNRLDFIYDDKGKANENVRAVGKRRSDIWKAKDIIYRFYT